VVRKVVQKSRKVVQNEKSGPESEKVLNLRTRILGPETKA